jgi:hypothetical protein
VFTGQKAAVGWGRREEENNQIAQVPTHCTTQTWKSLCSWYKTSESSETSLSLSDKKYFYKPWCIIVVFSFKDISRVLKKRKR